LGCNQPAEFGFRLEFIADVAIVSRDGNVGLIRQANQMSQDTETPGITLYLAKYHVTGIERRTDGEQVALRPRLAKNGCISDYAEPVPAVGS
jgi:hypothetical protein